MRLPAPRPRRAAIIGAGIAGVATAISLRRAGWVVDVFERAPRLRIGGGVLMLWPNGLQALETLGLAEAIRAVAVPLARLRVHSWSGRLALNVAAPRWRQALGDVPVYVPRRALLQTLVTHLDDEHIHFANELIELAGPHGAPVFRVDGERQQLPSPPTLLVGADGIRSRVSTLLGNPGPAREIATLWLGRMPTRAHPWLPAPGEVVIVHGRRFRVILGTLPGSAREHETLEWTIYDNQSRSRSHPAVLDFAELTRATRSCGFPIAKLLEHTSEPQRLTVSVQPPNRRWRRDAVVLVGDAAHASSPELGQGACQSFESAVALALALDRAASLERGLADYERTRRARTTAVVHAATLSTMLAGLGSPTIDTCRDLLLQPGWSVIGQRLVQAIAAR